MSVDNSPKQIVLSRAPRDGDLLKYDSATDTWVQVNIDDFLATATVIGAYTLPVADGNPGDILSTDGSGVLSWIAP
jgi:hypothetical protein